ncbi:MAG: HAMP domain-containing protein, partial [Euryarchaeota archaeon]|nr:HAMP domain-containing protein [Euryarchaeota archaeon]
MSVNRKLMTGFGLVLLLTAGLAAIMPEKGIGYIDYVASSSARTAIAAFVIAAIITGAVNALIISRAIIRSLNRVIIGANKTRNLGMGCGILSASGVVGAFPTVLTTIPGASSTAEEKSEETPIEQEEPNKEQERLEDITLIDQPTSENEGTASNAATLEEPLNSEADQLADQTNRTEEPNNQVVESGLKMEECEERLDELTRENEYLKTQIRDFVPLMNSLAGGDLTKRAAKTRDDELGELADAYNNTVENIRALVDDAGVLAEAGIEGRLDTRADASRHQGDFRKIVDGVNDMLDGVNRPLKVVIEY